VLVYAEDDFPQSGFAFRQTAQENGASALAATPQFRERDFSVLPMQESGIGVFDLIN